MNLALLLEIVAEAISDRVAVVCGTERVTYGQLLERSRRAAALLGDVRADHVVYVGLNAAVLPTAAFGAAIAGRPFVPLNYRLADAALRGLVERVTPAVLLADAPTRDRIGAVDGVEPIEPAALSAEASAPPASSAASEPDDVAVLLFTSGTTGEPKAAMLRHRHLSSYVLSSVEPFSAEEDEAALVSVPPYHVAGIAGVLSSVYAGRRIVYLPQFDPAAWVDTVRAESVTHAMVVPTMLRRILDVMERRGDRLPTLRHLAYGGGRMPLPVVERAMRVLPHVDLVNAYGLTETSSTIAVLGPEDHREAFAGHDPAVRARLVSVGRPLPHLEVGIRDAAGTPLPAGVRGEIWVRGDQVAGEYLGQGTQLIDGWFPTRDAGWLDDAGYLFVDGRIDDVIVRGGENLSPGEIEAVLLDHPAVAEAAVVGVPDVEWGEAVVAAVVANDGATVTEDELRRLVAARLRSSRMPERIVFRDHLPYNETGKLLRRVLRAELAPEATRAAG